LRNYHAIVTESEAPIFGDGEDELDPRRYIYHYTSTDTAALILTSGCLRMGPLGKTNDPRETNNWWPSLTIDVGSADDPDSDNWRALCAEIDRALRGRTKLACFTNDRAWDSNRLGEPPYHRGWARARMWDQYASRHSGVCLMLDRSRWLTAVSSVVGDLAAEHGIEPQILHGDVGYHDRAIGRTEALHFRRSELNELGVSAAADARLGTHGDEFFFSKNTDWESEVEFRTVLLGIDEDHCDIPIADCLEAVIVGEKYPDPELKVLKYRLSMIGIDDLPIATCDWWGGSPQLVPDAPHRRTDD
jgi:hypothetical protein